MTRRGDIGSLSPLELATGIVTGTGPAPAGDDEPAPRSPLEALESACRGALRRPPCLVSFSGGLDSSLVLAAATGVARREGLPLPIPATNRFPLADHTDETEWQELVVGRLGIEDWLRIELTDELDVVGEVATRALTRHGLLWPFNAHFHVPILDAAAGGTVLTGIGGDEVLGRSRWARATAALTGRVRPTRHDVPRVVFLGAPHWLKRDVIARRMPAVFPWLTAPAAHEFTRRWAADEASQPARLERRLRDLDRARWLQLGLRSMDLLAADAGAAIVHPLATRSFRSGFAGIAPRYGFHRGRSAAIRACFDGLLPPQLLERGSKARFEGAFWGPASRAFASGWDGTGIDPSVVDAAALRAEWALDEPDAHTYLLLQHLWLERSANGRLKKGHLGLSASGART